ncbi:MAG: hypothetical protein EBR38_05920 [Flavobacteriaceae bacterium]|nr:hypothetical protein [Flavobacteriaceae bacterium]
MELFKNSLKKITVIDSKLLIEKKYLSKTDFIELTSISKIYIKRKRIRNLYFFDIISFILLVIGILTFNCVSAYIFFFLILLFIFWTVYLIYYKSYYLHVEFFNNQSKNYFFSSEIKYDVLEQVKIVRKKLSSLN